MIVITEVDESDVGTLCKGMFYKLSDCDHKMEKDIMIEVSNGWGCGVCGSNHWLLGNGNSYTKFEYVSLSDYL